MLSVLGLWLAENYRNGFAQEIGASGIDCGADGHTLSKAALVCMRGNSVHPPVARARRGELRRAAA